MSDHHGYHDDLTARIEAYFDGLLDADQVAALEDELRREPEAMKQYLAWMSLHAELSWTHRAAGESESVVRQIAPSGAIDRNDAVTSTASVTTRRAWWARGVAAAAAVAIVAGVWMGINDSANTTDNTSVAQTAPDSTPVATLTDSADAVWAADSSVHDMLEPGVGIPAGPVRLQSGSAQLMFKSGAVVTLLGPTEMQMTGSNTCRLDRGALMAFVPAQATGFTVETPDATVVDLGTEFGLRVDDTGVSALQVFDGQVRATPRGGNGSVTYTGPAAVRFDGPNAPSAIEPLSKADFRDELGVVLPFRYAHWSFDSAAADGDTPVTVHGFDAAALATRLRYAGGADDATGPTLVDGRFGKAASFDGINDYVITRFEGIGADTPRTVAMWVRVPEDWQASEGFALVHWGTHDVGRAWQVSINPRSEDGPVGRFRIGINGGQAVGTTDLRDGRWHHVAVVFLGGMDADVATHTRLYVDGELESLGGTASQPVDTATGLTGPHHPVTFGRNITGQPGNQFGFRGAIDEAYLFDTALSRRQIQRLMTDNAPPEQPR